MGNKDENKLLNNLKMRIAIANFEKEFENSNNNRTIKYPLKSYIEEWRKNIMKKKALVATFTSIILISGIAFATNIENIKSYIRGLGGGIDSAIEHDYIESPEMNYIKSSTSLNDMEDREIIDNIKVETKVENFLMDDYNLSVEFNFKFDDAIKEKVDLDNIDNIELKDLIIRDEENRIIYTGNDEESFNEYCKENNLNYKFGEFNENYLNNGLNWFPSYHSKEENIVKLMYNMYTDKYPKSKKLYFSFGNIIIREENNKNIVELKGEWNIELDVPEKMYNRTSESYKVVSCSNDDFEVYSSNVSDTGFEIGVIINNIEKVERPEELEQIRRNIWSKYEGVVDQTEANKEFNKVITKSPYKEMYQEYWNKRFPINCTDVEIKDITENGIQMQEANGSYVENSEGKQFKCTMSPSRKAKCEWLDGNKYDFYETFGMTKYEATDKIKVVLYYYGEPVIIELEKQDNEE